MRIDLDTVGVKGAMSVERVRRVLIQCVPVDGTPSSAVVEVKRAFSPSSPSASFSSTQTLTLDGSAITSIDVTDTAWIHFVCTTAQSGVRVNVEIETRGSVNGLAFEDTYDLTDTGPRGVVDVSGRYRAFLMLDPRESNSAVLEIKRRIGMGTDALSFASALEPTISSSAITEIDTDESGFLVPVCTTSQSEQRVTAYWYVRERVESDLVRGTAFPANPSDGQRFTRTDLDYETFTWDATREKWLGELRSMFAARNYTGTGTGGGLTLAFDGVLLDDNTGFGIDHDFTIVGAEFTSKQALSIDLDWHHAGTKQTTLMSMSSEASKSDYTIDYDETAAVSNILRFELSNRTSGTIDDPVVKLWYRRKAT